MDALASTIDGRLKYGLVAPGRRIEPYEMTLKGMPIGERQRWADDVLENILREVPDLRHAVFLAGLPYREFLGLVLRNRGVTLEVPMEGLRSGQQLQWFQQHSA